MSTLQDHTFERNSSPDNGELLSETQQPHKEHFNKKFNLLDHLPNVSYPSLTENFEGKDLPNINSINEDVENTLICSPDAKDITCDISLKIEDTEIIKPEKRRSLSVTRNEPPPLIHYLQDKDLPKVDNENSPPQLLPEIIVTRTKLQKEKGQSNLEGSSFKVTSNKPTKKLKRSWLRYSYNNSLSDDQASNESHEHLLYTDTSQSSSSASGSKKGLSFSSEKRKRTKFSETVGNMGTPPEALKIPKSANYGNLNYGVNSHNEKVGRDNKMDYTYKSQLGDGDIESLCDIKSDIDFESWMTETEDEDEDIFITPQRVSTGKEERDTIDGIEFLGFETEHDMVEFTKIELDFQGGALQEENVSHSDDGLDMMDDSYTYSESETQTTSQAIIPTKTKDITKIKGWRTKNFAINNNPSDGQCSSSSVGPYDDDDGFVSCDIKIEEDASLDMEEPGDLWSSGEQDLFTHDDPLEKYSSDDSFKKIEETFVGQSSIDKSEKLVPENKSGETQSPGESIAKESSEDTDLKVGRYPKRHSAMSNSLNAVSNLNETDLKQTQSSPIKTPKKRGRKPKTVAEKRLTLQLANQYKRRRRRGRPKGSKNKPFLIFTKTINGRSYNLRNSKKESDILDMEITKQDIGDQFGDNFDSNRKSVSIVDTPKKEAKKEHGKTICKEKLNAMVLEPVKVKEEPLDYGFGNTDIDGFTETIESNVLCCLSTTTLTTNTSPITASTNCPGTTCSSSLASKMSHSSSSSPSNSVSVVAMPSIPTDKAHVTSSTTSLSSSFGYTDNSLSTHTGNELLSDEVKDESMQKCNENIVSLVNPSDKKLLEYGLILTTGIRRPVVALAMEQLRMLRKDNYSIDEHWAIFSASVVLSRSQGTSTPQTNTIIIPVRSQSLPFTSFNPQGNHKVNEIPSSKRVLPLTRSFCDPPFAPPVPSPARFAPMVGSSVRFRCPRPSTQVGVRTLPSTIPHKNFTQGTSNSSVPKFYKIKVPFPLKSTDKYRLIIPNKSKLFSSEYNSDDIDEEIKKVVDDIVKYVERSEDNDSLIPEDPHNIPQCAEPALVPVIPRKKKAPMIRELSRLDVNVIEMWDAKNKKCTEEFCKLGCICESLECCRPAIDEHCGKEACMFKCECESQTYRRDSRQLSLLSPLSLLNIPQQNRRVLAKEEKEFQQTVIRAKHETIVVGSNGSSRRKREIKLPGRYRDSYVALGKEYGLVDFKISSNDHIESPTKRSTRISIINAKESVSVSPKKSSPISSKMTWESKEMKLKKKHGIRKCYVKLEKNDYFEKNNSEIKDGWEINTSYESDNSEASLSQNVNFASESGDSKNIGQKSNSRSRNFAVKSTSYRSSVFCDDTYRSARTVPVNLQLLKRYKRSSVHCDDKLVPSEVGTHASGSSNVMEETITDSSLSLNEPKLHNSAPSDLVIDNCAEGFGKIESVTTLSVEQFQKGDLGFGVEAKEEEEDLPVITGETKPVVSMPNTYKFYKGKNSGSLSFNKIASLLNRRIRELKENGGNVSFPLPGNEESIHLLPWTVLRSLFHVKDIQLWYYKGSSKLVITSTTASPGSSFVNLNDTSPSDHKTMPPIIRDLFKSEQLDRNANNPGVYALLHFDGKHVELVGTIYKNQRISQSGKLEQNHSVKIMSGSRIEHQKPLNLDTEDSKSIMDLPSSSIFDLKKIMKNPTLVPNVLSSDKGSTSIDMEILVSNKNIDSEVTITEVQEIKGKDKDLVHMSDTISPAKRQKLKNRKSTQSPSDVSNSTEKVNSIVKSRDVNKIKNFEKRIKRFTTFLQSSKVLTADGVNVPVPLPSCAVDSRWYVLCMEKEFEILMVNKCSVRKELISQSIKMALKHCKIVRLPLQIVRKSNENINHPNIGVYAVPAISSFVFIGPFNLDEQLNITTGIIKNGRLVSINDTDDKESANFTSNISSEKNSPSSIVDILKRIWCSRKAEEKDGLWLYTKKNLNLDETVMLKKIGTPSAVAECDKDGKDVMKKSCSQSLGFDSPKEEIHSTTCNKTNDQEISIIKSVKYPQVFQSEKVIASKPENKVSSSVACSTAFLRSGKLIDSKDRNMKSDGGLSKNDSEELLLSFPTSSRKFTTQNKSPLASIMKPVKSVPSKTIKPLAVPVAGWLVPSYSWIGCMRCNFDVDGGLFFSHPVSGVKMSFSNLESAQLWLDRLFQSAILYIPRQLFITWSLKLDSGDESNVFDPTILNGDYIMTVKGIFVIDDLVPTEAEKYGLKPIEILRLQDKKKRRDLELGFFQLRRASEEVGMSKSSHKIDVVTKALTTIKELTVESRSLERESKQWKSTKHKSLLRFYSLMKAFPIREKSKIVAKLKNQFDQIEASKGKLVDETDGLLDGLTYSMSRYCGNSSIFGEDVGDSDVNEYLSECEEADDDCDEIPKVLEKTAVKRHIEEILPPEKKRRTDSHEDDESVSISVVSSSFNVNQDKSISNSDDVTVTCLSKTNSSGKPVESFFNLKNTGTIRRKSVSETRQGSSGLIPSPAIVTLSPDEVSPNTSCGAVKSSASVKKNLFGSSSSVSEDFKGDSAGFKHFKHDSADLTPITSCFKNSKSAVTSDKKDFGKEYRAMKIDSPTKYSHNLVKSSVVAFKNWPSSSSSSISNTVKNPLFIAPKSVVSTSNTLFVNVISSNQSKVVPLHVESPRTNKGFNALQFPIAKGTLTAPKNSLKLLPNNVKHLMRKGQNEPLSVFITNPLPASSRVHAPSGTITPVTLESARPVIAVKSFAKESASNIREVSTLLPTLVPIVDRKHKPTNKVATDKTNPSILKAIAPLPTLIPIVDQIPAEIRKKNN